jgi:hypothetical protein
MIKFFVVLVLAAGAFSLGAGYGMRTTPQLIESIESGPAP